MGESPIYWLISIVTVDKHYRIRRRLRTRAFDPGAFRPPGGDPRAAQTRSIERRFFGSWPMVGRWIGYPNAMRP